MIVTCKSVYYYPAGGEVEGDGRRYWKLSYNSILILEVKGLDGRIYTFPIGLPFKKAIGRLTLKRREIITQLMPGTITLTNVEQRKNGKIKKAEISNVCLQVWIDQVKKSLLSSRKPKR